MYKGDGQENCLKSDWVIFQKTMHLRTRKPALFSKRVLAQGGLSPITRAASYPKRGMNLERVSLMITRPLEYHNSLI